MFRKRSFESVFVALCATLCVLFVQHETLAHESSTIPLSVPQITQAIDPSQLMPMQTNVRPEASSENDRGAVADDFPMEHMFLLLHRPDAQEQALEQFMDEQTTFGASNYHNWLTSEQVGQYGPAQADLDTVASWLQSLGFTINKIHSDGMMIDFSGNAGQVRQAFKTEIHNLVVNGETHIANMSVPEIPSALAPAVVGIVSLNNFRPHTNIKPKTEYKFTNSNGTFQVVPADLATIYNLNSLFTAGINGAGQTIVLLEEENPYNTVNGVNADINKFRSTFGLPAFTASGPKYSEVHPGGCANPGNSNDGTDGEVELDIEWAGASAPHANLVMASCADTTTYGVIVAMQNLNSANDSAKLWSISYGLCEAQNGASFNAAFSSTYQTAAARGVSVFVASGDEGAASCDANKTQATHGIGVSGWTSTPYNVSVGGTDFGDSFAGTNSSYWSSANSPTFGSALSYINEIPWNDSCASVLLATIISGSGTTYGTNGFCNNSTASNDGLLATASGSGGPSGCATGSPSTDSVVSGSCHGTAKPSWQSGLVGNPADSVRDIPDVSLFAANGVWGHFFVYCFSNPADGGTPCTTGNPSAWSGAGGTSFSSPIMAGIQALVNQKTGSSQGNPNPTYYSLAKTEYGASGNSNCNSTLGHSVSPSCIFYDVKQGDIDVNCLPLSGTLHNCYRPSGTNGVLSTSNNSYQPAYGTGTGWDFATGIGTVNAANLVNHWPGVVSTPTKLAFTVEPNASYASGATITVKVSVEDSSGNVITTDTSAMAVTLTGGTAGATLGGTKSVNAVAGVATFPNLTVDKVGTGYQLTATDGTLTAATSTSFNITAGVAKTFTLTTQPAVGSNIAAGTTIPLVAHVVDAGGNAVANENLSLAIGANPGGSTLFVTANPVQTDSSGNATFSNVSLDKVGTGYTLLVTDNTTVAVGTVTSNQFNIVAGTAASISFSTQPASGSNIPAGGAIALIAHVADAKGNAVPLQSVSLAIGTNPGSSTLTVGANPVQTDASGNATFANVSLNKNGTGYTLVATDNSVPSLAVPTNSFNIIAGAPAAISFTQQPTNAAVNALIVPAIVVRILDGAGNAVAGDDVTLSIGANPGGAMLAGGNAVATDASGNATFSVVSLNKVGNGYTLIATDGSSTSLMVTSAAFNISAGAPSLVFTTQPMNVAAGNALATIVITEEDSSGQTVDDSTNIVDFTLPACGGTVDLGSAMMAHGVATLTPVQKFYTLTNSPGLRITATSGTLTGASQYFSVVANPDLLFSDGFDGCRL